MLILSPPDGLYNPRPMEHTFINSRPKSIKYYRERNVQCCRACSRGMHQGLFALNPFPSFFMSHLLLKPDKKRSDIQWSGNFFSIHYRFITHTKYNFVFVSVQDILRRFFRGDYAGKYPRKVFSPNPSPFEKLFFRSDVMEKASPPSKCTHKQPPQRPSPRYQSVSLVSSLPGNCFLR